MITYRQEDWFDCKEEIKPLAETHFNECMATQGGAQFDLDETGLDGLAKAGLMHITTARDGLDLVAYIVNLIMPRHTLFNRPFASQMGWYVKPKYRGRVGLQILNKSEEFLKGKVDVMLGMHTATTDCSKLFSRLGWMQSEINYMKWVA